MNKLRGQLPVTAVKAPGFGDKHKSILGDSAILTGGTVFINELDIKLERATPDLLGSTGLSPSPRMIQLYSKDSI